MRYTRALAPVIAVAMILAACGGDDDDEPAAAPEPTEAAVGPTATSSESAAPVGSAAPEETTAAPASTGGVFRWGTTSIPPSMDPAQSGSDANVVYFLATYENLIRVDVNGELIPGLATDWSLSDDGLTFDLTLRTGVTFQDDTPVDAGAVVANFEHYRADDSLLAPALGLIDSVEAVDDTHVRFKLNRPGGDLPEILRGYAGMMASPASIEAGTLATEPVGAGPFRVTSITDTGVIYERWDGYWDAAAVSLDGLEVHLMTDDAARLNAVRSGQLDATFIRPNQAAEAEAAGLETATGPRVFTYSLLVSPARFPDPDVRRAISMAIDRASIESFLYDDRCTPTAQLFPPQYWAYDDSIDDASFSAFDPEGARGLLASAAPDGLSLTILTPTITNYQRLAEVLQDQLGQVGIEVALEPIDSADLSPRVRAGEYDAVVSPAYSANPDPSTFATTYYVTEAGGSEFLVPEIGAAVAASRQTVDRDERAAAIGAISAAVLDAGTSVIGVCIPDIVFGYRPGISGLAVPLLGTYDFRNVVIEE